jgi:SAM-dependent methyltransferase
MSVFSTFVGEAADGAAFDIVAYHHRMLAQAGRTLAPRARVLDFGCGDGGHVYEFRDAGYDAYGFDIRPAPVYREPGDERWFRFALTGRAVNHPDYTIDPAAYRIPFEDESFDFVFSNSTMEHVQDQEAAFRETARVLKRGGCAMHTFPSRYRLIEPHIGVPLGSACRHPAWFRLWAALGVRNPYQGAMGTRECASDNAAYARHGLNYPSVRRQVAACRPYFARVDVRVGPRLAQMLGNGAGVRGFVIEASGVGALTRWLYSRVWNVVLFLEK